MTVVTLTRLTPPARDDNTPWTAALVQEGSVQAGPFSTIDTLTLSPVDTDPANPASRDLTTTHGTLTDGWYQVVWQDAASHQSAPTDPVQNTPQAGGGARPTVTEVAALIRARTKITGGKELGTFSTLTRPTSDEVETLIDDAIDEVLGKVQPIDPTLPPGSGYNAPGSDYERRTRRTIALYVAILIELSYWPEQVQANRSPVAALQQLYDSRIRALIAEGETGRAEGMGVGGKGGGGGDAPADAAWSFPDFQPGALIGWTSRW